MGGGVESPVLDTLSVSAVAAYSLRKLRTAYVGSAIRVRRSSDNVEQDIGFTASGNLDSAALLNFTNVTSPLDVVTGASAAYALRKLRAAYAGAAIRVRRSSDNAEQDIGFTNTGGLDTSTLLTFVGSGSGFVTTWYDQAGSVNATQATAANQPRIVNAGVVETQNGKPAIRGLNASQTRLSTASITVGSYHYVFSDPVPSGPSTFRALSCGSTTRANHLLGQAQPVGTIGGNGVATLGGFVDGATVPSLVNFNDFTIGVAIDTNPHILSVTRSTPVADGLVLLYDTILSTRGWDGYVHEMLFYPAALSTTNQQSIEASQSIYYGITVAATSQPSAFVTTWYDQSGNTRDGAQATTANQPRIVNVGAIETLGGKPTVRFLGGSGQGLLVANRPLTGALDLSVNAIFNIETADSNEMVFTQSDAVGTTGVLELRRQGVADNMQVLYGGGALSLTGSVNSTNQITTVVRVSGASANAWRNGTNVLSNVNASVLPINDVACNIGNRNGLLALNGTLSGVTVFTSALSTADRQALERSQGPFYGITVA
jgi:hypothetical protein